MMIVSSCKMMSCWNFSLDYTGSLVNINNMLHLVKEAGEMGDVLLVRHFMISAVVNSSFSQTFKLTFCFHIIPLENN
jgi:hypothetical protein